MGSFFPLLVIGTLLAISFRVGILGIYCCLLGFLMNICVMMSIHFLGGVTHDGLRFSLMGNLA